MKINPMQSVNAYQKLQETQKQQAHDKQTRSDQVEISQEAKELAESKENRSPEQQERIDAIKEQVKNGTYEVNAQETARKFYEFWN